MKISVCIPSYRLGGVDLLLWGLTRQTFTDFELVLIDGLFDRRHEMVMDCFGSVKIPIVHGPPRLRNFPNDSCGQYRNTAIARASGELLVWATDYSFGHTTWLEEHWAMYEKTQRKYVLAAPHEYIWPPAFRDGLPWWAPISRKESKGNAEATYLYDEEATLGYTKEVLSGQWDQFLWSIFDPSLEPSDLDIIKDDVIFGARSGQVRVTDVNNQAILLQDCSAHSETVFAQPDVKHQLFMRNHPDAILIPGELLHFKNESCLRSSCVAVNGFDEFYDGAHSYDDIDMGKRLERIGVKWVLGPSPLKIVNVRHYFPAALRSVGHRTHEQYYHNLDSRSSYAANPIKIEDTIQWYRN